MMTSTDQYGDMNLEDVDEFEGLEPDSELEFDPLGRFQKGEVRNFEEDFGFKLDQILAEDEIDDAEDTEDGAKARSDESDYEEGAYHLDEG